MQLKKLITELAGTFFLALVIMLAQNPLATGATLMSLIYMGSAVSGGHYSPAVTLAFMIQKKIDIRQSITYMLIQTAGALLAAYMYHFIFGETFDLKPHPGFTWNIKPFAVETVCTFFIIMVVLHVGAFDKTSGNGYFGLAIGGVAAAAGYAGGPISGGAFNPAIGIGPVVIRGLFDHGDFSFLWIYIAGPLLGSFVASALFRRMHPSQP
jgi:aquaporin Z